MADILRFGDLLIDFVPTESAGHHPLAAPA